MIDIILEHLSFTKPLVGSITEVFTANYLTTLDLTVDDNWMTDRQYWERNATFLMIILCAEGEEI